MAMETSKNLDDLLLTVAQGDEDGHQLQKERNELREQVTKILSEEIKKRLKEQGPNQAEVSEKVEQLKESLEALQTSSQVNELDQTRRSIDKFVVDSNPNSSDEMKLVDTLEKQEVTTIVDSKDMIHKSCGIGTTIQEYSPYTISIGKTHHIGARDNQQDSLGLSNMKNPSIVNKKGILAIVADGMGGLSYGSEISVIVTVSMLRYFHEKVFTERLELEFLKMLYHANQEVNEFLGISGIGCGGTTVVATIIKDRKLFWISVGDSHIYLFREGGLLQLNQDHNYGRVLDEKAARYEISFEEARNHSMRHALTSFIGIGNLTKIDRNIEPIQLLVGDRILLVSDGVYNTVSEEELIECMQGTVEESANLLESRIQSINKPNQDNYTAIIMECH